MKSGIPIRSTSSKFVHLMCTRLRATDTSISTAISDWVCRGLPCRAGQHRVRRGRDRGPLDFPARRHWRCSRRGRRAARAPRPWPRSGTARRSCAWWPRRARCQSWISSARRNPPRVPARFAPRAVASRGSRAPSSSRWLAQAWCVPGFMLSAVPRRATDGVGLPRRDGPVRSPSAGTRDERDRGVLGRIG